jgi:hypothetical protein
MPRKPAVPLAQPVFDEPVFTSGPPTPDPTGFRVPHPSDAKLYQQLQNLLYDEAVGFPRARGAPSDLYPLTEALGPHGPEAIAAINAAGRIVFQAVGDIGASTAGKYPDEIKVSDRVTADQRLSAPRDRPQFLYVLGDVIYDFGEAQYYFDQFYEPYRNYPAPIFALPGNHDSFIVPGTPTAQDPLVTFQRNFCSAEPVVTPEAGSLHRTAMTEPGVYFALDAPYVRIIGLFSNALEDPGIISSQDGEWTAVPDYQLDFLAAQLQRAASEGYTGALLLAMHHPPYCYAPETDDGGSGGPHGGSPKMLADIDTVCQKVGVYPHAVLSGHAHNYQRFTRTFQLGGRTREVPFLICGDGGHGITPLVQAAKGTRPVEPANGLDVSYLDAGSVIPSQSLVLDRHDDRDYGYLRLSVDARQLVIAYYPVGRQAPEEPPTDLVAVDLVSGTVATTPKGAPGRGAGRGGSPKPRARSSR